MVGSDIWVENFGVSAFLSGGELSQRSITIITSNLETGHQIAKDAKVRGLIQPLFPGSLTWALHTSTVRPPKSKGIANTKIKERNRQRYLTHIQKREEKTRSNQYIF